MTTEAMGSLGYGICTVAAVMAFSMGIAVVKSLLLQYCRNSNRPCSKSAHTRTRDTSHNA